MVAYSFQKQFAPQILARTKRQTIRALGTRRHARPDEFVQLYTGMRTKHCRLIYEAVCTSVEPITLDLRDHWIRFPATGVHYTKTRDLDFFARLDGFAGWSEMLAFWAKHHPGVPRFDGVLIKWEPPACRQAACDRKKGMQDADTGA